MHFTLYLAWIQATSARANPHELLIKHSYAWERRLIHVHCSGSLSAHTNIHTIGSCAKFNRGLKFDQNLKPYFKINLRFTEIDLCVYIQIASNKIVHYSAITHTNNKFIELIVFELLMIKRGKCFLKHAVQRNNRPLTMISAIFSSMRKIFGKIQSFHLHIAASEGQ